MLPMRCLINKTARHKSHHLKPKQVQNALSVTCSAKHLISGGSVRWHSIKLAFCFYFAKFQHQAYALHVKDCCVFNHSQQNIEFGSSDQFKLLNRERFDCVSTAVVFHLIALLFIAIRNHLAIHAATLVASGVSQST